MSAAGVEAYLRNKRESLEAETQIASDRLPWLRSRATTLLDDPEARRDDITGAKILKEQNTMAARRGQEFAAAYWGIVAELVDGKFSDLSNIPPFARDAIDESAMEIIFAVSIDQAFIESGQAQQAIAAGVESGALRARLFGSGSITMDEIVEAHKQVKTLVAESKG